MLVVFHVIRRHSARPSTSEILTCGSFHRNTPVEFHCNTKRRRRFHTHTSLCRPSFRVHRVDYLLYTRTENRYTYRYTFPEFMREAVGTRRSNRDPSFYFVRRYRHCLRQIETRMRCQSQRSSRSLFFSTNDRPCDCIRCHAVIQMIIQRITR